MTQATDLERVRGYLLSQGERYTFAEMWPRATKARLQVLDALEGLTAEQARFKPAADEWSIAEVLLHLLASSASTRRLVEDLSGGRNGDASGVEAGLRPEEAGVEELRARLVADSISWSALTERLPEEPVLERTASHRFFGALHCRAWYLFQRVHDIDHLNQIEAVKNSAGYPGA